VVCWDRGVLQRYWNIAGEEYQTCKIGYVFGRHQTYEKNLEILGGALRKAQYASSHSLCGSGSHDTECCSRFAGWAG
jgi:hypothetical protein